MIRTASNASAASARRPSPHGPRGSLSPVSTTATCCGCCGSDASSAAISSSVGRRSTGITATPLVCSVGCTTCAIANNATSTMPRDTLRDNASSSAGQQRRRQMRPIGLQRIDHPGGAAPSVVGGQAPGIEHTRRQKRCRKDFDVTGQCQRLADRSAATLNGGQPAAGRSRRQHRRNDFQPFQSQHLFDEVGRLQQVWTPARRGHDQTVCRLRSPRRRSESSRRAVVPGR